MSRFRIILSRRHKEGQAPFQELAPRDEPPSAALLPPIGAKYVPPAAASTIGPFQPPGPPSQAAALDRLASVLREKQASSITKDTRATYEGTYKAYVKWCREYGLADPTDAATVEPLSLTGFLWWKATETRNARSWSTWQAHIASYAEKFLRQRPLSYEEGKFMRSHRRACAVEVGIKTTTSDPVTELTLRRILLQAEPQKRGARLFAIFMQLVVAKSCTTRPGETANTGNGDNSDRLCAKDVKFVEADPLLGMPACVELSLRNTKKIKLTGLNKAAGERSIAAESSIELLCPVRALKTIFTAYGLHDPMRANEPVFARMRHDGSRIYADPASATGAAFITSREVNEQIAILCDLAKIQRFTLRATRHGSCCDMEAAGASEALANAAGRWQPGSRPPYSHMTQEGAAKLKELFEIMRARYPKET